MSTNTVVEVEAWGEYVSGHRIEIEPVDFSSLSWSGWGPTHPSARSKPERWLVQRDRESPHPITWHSPAYATLEDARHAGIRLVGDVPYLTNLACDIHWSTFGCDGDKDADGSTRSYDQCRSKACREYARTLLRAIAEDAGIVLELLEKTEERPVTAQL